MDDLQHLGMERVQPNVHTYSSLMNARATQSSNESAVSQVEWLLSNMEQQSGQTWDKKLKPNTQTCTIFINALAKSGKIGAASRAFHVF
jgi:pentatricopeptide repeat protein